METLSGLKEQISTEWSSRKGWVWRLKGESHGCLSHNERVEMRRSNYLLAWIEFEFLLVGEKSQERCWDLRYRFEVSKHRVLPARQAHELIQGSKSEA